jgi:3-methylcrotonyl-CoA carboxylase alpha subunit
MPATSKEVRVDTGFRAGDTVSPFYDPMLAKLIVHGGDRDAALRRMQAALARCEIVGVTTNAGFLERMIALPDFAVGRLDTGLIERNRDVLLAPSGRARETSAHAGSLPSPHPDPLPPAREGARPGTVREEGAERGAVERALIVAAIAEWRAQTAATADASDPHSPWNATDAWWLNSERHRVVFEFDEADARYRVALHPQSDGSVRVETAHGDATVLLPHHGTDRPTLIVDSERIRASVVTQGAARNVFGDGLRRRFTLVDPMTGHDEQADTGGHLRAPMSGTIVAVLVKSGETVVKGAPLVVLEAMKMEHTIVAITDGLVSAVNCAVGERVAEGADLVDLDA